MRIFLIADHAAPHTRRWARWFALRGHQVHVLSFNPDGLSGYEPARVHVLWHRAGGSLAARIAKTPMILARMRLLARQFRPDVIHAHSSGGYAWTTYFSGLRPYVVTPWGTDLLVDTAASRSNAWLTRQSMQHAALVTTDGVHMLDVLEKLGIPRAEVLLHTFGVDVSKFAPGSDEGERDALGLGEHPVVISTRTPNPVHDVETFIRALPAIHDRHPEARFVVVGDGAVRAQLEALAHTLGVAEQTRFTGMVDEMRMLRLLRAATIYVSTSFMDAGLAASTAEAMAIALPVIQTDNSDNAMWTPDGVGGYLVPNGDAAAIADRVIRLLDDPTTARRMGEANRAVIMERYNLDVEMGRVERAYTAIAQRHRR